MIRIIVVVLVSLALFTCSSDGDYNQIVQDLRNDIEVNKSFNEGYLMSAADYKTLEEISPSGMTDKRIDDLVEKRNYQQKKQFEKVLKRLMNSKYGAFTYSKSDGVDGVIKGIHYYDIALFYERQKDGDKDERVCVFEMVLVNDNFKMIDDIYLTWVNNWDANVRRKNIQIEKYKNKNG